MKQLLDDIARGDVDFEVLLVYDVSRFGRFQDPDEAALYEIQCKRAGIRVLYCAEQFENDGTIGSSIIKTVKRAMAGEYIRVKKRLLDGICDEVVKLLHDRQVPLHTFTELKRLRPMRQISVAETMIALNRFTVSCAKSLVASSPQSDLIMGERKSVKGLSDEQLERMERETKNLDREFKLIEQEYGTDHLDLVLATGYLCRLIENVRIVHHLARLHPEVLAEFQKIAQLRAAA